MQWYQEIYNLPGDGWFQNLTEKNLMIKFQYIQLLSSQHCSIIGDKSQQGYRKNKIILFLFTFFIFLSFFLITLLETVTAGRE